MKKDSTIEATAATTPAVPEEPIAPLWLTRTLTTLAYGIPLAFLAYVLYINYLPFGYEKTFTIDVGTEGDTDNRKAFFLQPSPDLSEQIFAEDGTTYRELNGISYVVFNPTVVLKNAEVTVKVEGGDVTVILPNIDFNPNDYEWDYEWDFTNKETALTPRVSERARAEWPDGNVPELAGDAFWFDGCMYFDGNTKLELPNSHDKFENGPFTVYAEWIPQRSGKEFEQIIGHFNWELLQNNEYVKFQIGRTNNNEGVFHSVTKSITTDNFWRDNHTALFTYAPSKSEGYISLYVDNIFIGRKNISDEVIYSEYGNRNLTIGQSFHDKTVPLVGKLCSLRYSLNKTDRFYPTYTTSLNDQTNKILIVSDETTQITKITATVRQNK